MARESPVASSSGLHVHNVAQLAGHWPPLSLTASGAMNDISHNIRIRGPAGRSSYTAPRPVPNLASLDRYLTNALGL
jgi:hypothetical protein